MPDADPVPERSRLKSLPLVQREVALILVLCVVSVVLFLATRRLAGWSRDVNENAGREWYARGEMLVAAGDSVGGIAALRRAVAADPRNVDHLLALARALTTINQDDEARQLLLRLRESEPEQTEINYRLARLAAKRGDTAEAVRYYYHAMYGLGPTDGPVDRERIETELASLLIIQDDREGALAVLATLGREMPNTAAAHLELASLLLRAGDVGQALTHYTTAADLDKQSAAAMAGAGEAAFALNNFALAERDYVEAERRGDTSDGVRQHLASARLIASTDPLAARLSMTDRVRRLTAGLSWAESRLGACPSDAAVAAAATALRDELTAFRRQPAPALRDSDVITAGVDLIGRIESLARRECGTPGPDDDAWEHISQVHGGSRQ
jgi:tetratricopeptide (TPR) repeat protein